MSMPAVVFVRNLSNPQTPQLHLIDKRDRLHAVDKLILSTIATYLSLDPNRIAWPSVRTLAADCWTSERGVQRSLARLEKAKLLHRETGGGIRRTNTYRITGFSPMPGDAAPPIAATPPPPKNHAPTPPPVSPQNVIRDTQPPPPVSPAYKEYESTCESTVKGEGTRTIEAVCTPPEKTPPKSLATQVIENLSLPNVPGLAFSVEKAISAEANYQRIELAAAARFISDWCAAAQAHGVPINRFAFEDVIWRNNGSRKQTPGEDRANQRRSIILGAVSAVFSNRDGHYGSPYEDSSRTLRG